MYEQQTQQTVLVESTDLVANHPGAPWYFSEDFSWWWIGVFVPIVIAYIVNHSIKKRKKLSH